MNNGIVYICFLNTFNKRFEEDLAFKEMQVSIESSHKHNPKIPITVYSDIDFKIKGVNVVKINPPKQNRIKSDVLPLSPYDNTLYLDCDTKFVNPIDDVFLLSEKYDVALAIDYIRINTDKSRSFNRYFDIPFCFPEFGGGVMLYRKNDITSQFFKKWKSIYNDGLNHGVETDQQSLRITLWEMEDLQLFTLPPEFNLRTQEKRDSCMKKYPIPPRIYHWHSMFDPKINDIRTPYQY